MFINNTQCEHCNHQFDEMLSRCPYCHQENKNKASLPYKNKMVFMPIAYQFIVFLVGLGGLFLFEFIFQLCLQGVIPHSDPGGILKLNAVVIFPSYACLFVALFLLVFKYLPEFAEHFKKVKPYLMGIVFGIGLIVFSLIYTTIVNSCCPGLDLNENEKNARNLTVFYPFLSIIILCFIGPICEEITYRVGLFSALSRFNRWLAYITTILVFALIHFDFASPNIGVEALYLPVYLVSGLLLTICYEQEGPAASITAHMINNLYSVLGVLIVNGISK